MCGVSRHHACSSVAWCLPAAPLLLQLPCCSGWSLHVRRCYGHPPSLPSLFTTLQPHNHMFWGVMWLSLCACVIVCTLIVVPLSASSCCSYLVAVGGRSMYVAFMGTKQARDVSTDLAFAHEAVWVAAEQQAAAAAQVCVCVGGGGVGLCRWQWQSGQQTS
jgi:hypothetical protein